MRGLRPLLTVVVLWVAATKGAMAQDADALSSEQRLAGRGVTRLFEPVVKDARLATVRVMRDNQFAALGSVVSADGFIVTKASEVQGASLAVTLHDDRSFDAHLIAVDTDSDLALLRIEATGLTPVVWASGENKAEIGEWVAAPLPQAGKLGAGVISAQRRAVPRESGVMGVQFYPERPEDPNPGGVPISIVYPDSGAQAAGLKSGDIITKINGVPTPRSDDMLQAVSPHPPGDTLRVTFRRGGEEQEVEVTLGERSVVFKEFFSDRNLAISGEVSRRRSGFASILQHHIPLTPGQCGGPLVDLDGYVVGINIARANRSETFALPADIVRQVVRKLSGPQPSQPINTQAAPVPSDRR